jgi:CRISPR/Cas system-associated protein Csm6
VTEWTVPAADWQVQKELFRRAIDDTNPDQVAACVRYGDWLAAEADRMDAVGWQPSRPYELSPARLRAAAAQWRQGSPVAGGRL